MNYLVRIKNLRKYVKEQRNVYNSEKYRDQIVESADENFKLCAYLITLNSFRNK